MIIETTSRDALMLLNHVRYVTKNHLDHVVVEECIVLGDTGYLKRSSPEKGVIRIWPELWRGIVKEKRTRGEARGMTGGARWLQRWRRGEREERRRWSREGAADCWRSLRRGWRLE
ncbi:hypothetical protein RND71_038009 [Anisodus tanguticus]|uniref:Uncharacterized protein n=1 Tax=Anisodus tanguticus TaxID=243964 RepID=A0AAE1QZ61_9SOLA|nr:hypothetical protein RND71_038009 [Anisodus tanguticus]